MDRNLTLALFLALVCYALGQQHDYKKKEKIPEVDQRCMECICQASSNCDETIKCHNTGGGGYFCGPYVISWAYWHDAGRPGDHKRAHDFETCLNNKTCAEEAVRGYMRKYGQECDGQAPIDCGDFARIHKLGFGSCSDASIESTDYWEKFEICYYGAPPQDSYNQPPPQDNYPQPHNDYDYGDGVLQARNGRAN